MDTACKREIEELHHFFEQWFNAALPQTEDAFSRMDRVMGAEFSIVMPDGRKVDREPLLEVLYNANGQRAGIRIWIENVRILVEDGEITMAEYEEWQEEKGETTARLSTVVFRSAPGAPNGLSWLRVHETWIDVPADR